MGGWTEREKREKEFKKDKAFRVIVALALKI